MGVEPTNHEGLSFAALPVCVPCPRKPSPHLLQMGRGKGEGSSPSLEASPMGFEPTISTVTGWRGRPNSPTKTGVAGLCLRQDSRLKHPQAYAYGSPRSHHSFSNPGWTRTIVAWV